MSEEDKYTSFSWLIEAPGPTYLGARDLGKREFYWTRDHNSALRFFNAEQADGVMMAVREMSPDLFSFAISLGIDAKPTEHGLDAMMTLDECIAAARLPISVHYDPYSGWGIYDWSTRHGWEDDDIGLMRKRYVELRAEVTAWVDNELRTRLSEQQGEKR